MRLALQIIGIVAACFGLLVLIAGPFIEGEKFEIVDQRSNGCYVVERQHVPRWPGPNEVLDRETICPH